MIQLEQLTLLHRHGDEWRELPQAEPTPDDYDIERQVLRGGKLFRCHECDLDIIALPPNGE